MLCTDVTSSTSLGTMPGSLSYQLGISLTPAFPEEANREALHQPSLHLPMSYCCLVPFFSSSSPSSNPCPRGWFLQAEVVAWLTSKTCSHTPSVPNMGLSAAQTRKHVPVPEQRVTKHQHVQAGLMEKAPLLGTCAGHEELGVDGGW